MEEKNNSEIVESKNNKIFTWQLPKKNTQFFGRKEKIEAIKKQLADAEIKIAVIAGLGGVGKTQLSLAYIYNSKKDYGAILWFGAETENDLSLQFTALAQNEEEGFGWNVEGFSKKILTKKIYTYLLSQFKTILIVFDNVPSEKRNYIAQYLPDYKDINLDYSNIHILMTSRDQMTWNESWGFIKPISVDVFSPEESCQYIQYHLEKENKKDALKLAEILGYHPLALSQAVAYIKDESSVKKYIEIYINNEEKKKKFLNHSGFKKDNYLKTIYITWDMSMYALSSQKHALEFMRFCAYLSPDTIPNFLLKEWLNKEDEDISEIRKALIRYSLINIVDENSFRVHRLVQEVIRLQMSEQEDLKKESLLGSKVIFKEQVKKILIFIHDQFPDKDDRNREDKYDKNKNKFSKILPHAIVLVGYIKIYLFPEETAVTLNLIFRVCEYLYWRGNYRDVISLLIQTHDDYEKIHGKEKPHSDIAQISHDLGSAFINQKVYFEAKKWLKKSLNLKREIYKTEEHDEVAGTLHELGRLYTELRKFDKSEQIFAKVLSIDEKINKDNPWLTHSTRHELGRSLLGQKKLNEAHELFQKLIEDRTEYHKTKENIYVAKTMYEFGKVLYEQENYTDAQQTFKEVLEIEIKHWGTDEHVDVATTMYLLGKTLNAQRYLDKKFDPKQVFSLYERSLVILKKCYGIENIHVATVLNLLGEFFYYQGEYEGIEEKYFKKALIIFEAEDANHPHLLVIRDNIKKLQDSFIKKNDSNTDNLRLEYTDLISDKKLTNKIEILDKNSEIITTKLIYGKGINQILWEKGSMSKLTNSQFNNLKKLLVDDENISAEEVFGWLAKEGITWVMLLDTLVFSNEEDEDKLKLRQDMMDKLLDKRKQFDAGIYEEAALKAVHDIFSKNKKRDFTHKFSQEIKLDKDRKIEMRWYTINIFEGKHTDEARMRRDDPHWEIIIKAPGSKTPTSDIDTTISVKRINKVPKYAEDQDYTNLIKCNVIHFFNELSEEKTFGITSGVSRDSNVYADGFMEKDSKGNEIYDAFPEFSKNGESFLKLLDKDPMILYKENNTKKIQIEYAASLISLRMAIGEEKWNLFKKTIAEKYKDFEKIFIQVEKFFDYYDEQIKAEKTKKKESDFYKNSISVLDEKITEANLTVLALNTLYFEHLKKLSPLKEKIVKKEEEIERVFGELKDLENNIKELKEEENSDLYDDKDRFEKDKAKFEKLLKELAGLYNERQKALITANLFANDAYISRSATIHIVEGVQSGGDNKISPEMAISSALHQIGFYLLHSSNQRKEGLSAGEIIYRNAKYIHRIGELFFGTLKSKGIKEAVVLLKNLALKNFDNKIFSEDQVALVKSSYYFVNEIKKNGEIPDHKKFEESDKYLKEVIHLINKVDIKNIKTEDVQDFMENKIPTLLLSIANSFVVLGYMPKKETNLIEDMKIEKNISQLIIDSNSPIYKKENEKNENEENKKNIIILNNESNQNNNESNFAKKFN